MDTYLIDQSDDPQFPYVLLIVTGSKTTSTKLTKYQYEMLHDSVKRIEIREGRKL